MSDKLNCVVNHSVKITLELSLDEALWLASRTKDPVSFEAEPVEQKAIRNGIGKRMPSIKVLDQIKDVTNGKYKGG